VSHDLSRKHFVAKGLGLLALAGLAPKLRAVSASGSDAKASSLTGAKSRNSAATSATPKLRVEPRAVARTDSSPFVPDAASQSSSSTSSVFRN